MKKLDYVLPMKALPGSVLAAVDNQASAGARRAVWVHRVRVGQCVGDKCRLAMISLPWHP